jgi:uracil-DNA glycosylase
MPYVAPCHGGVGARMLSVLRDPGPKTQDGTGSGFLCIENDDPTAELQSVCFADVGIANMDFTPWNAYPWYINRKPTRTELDAGVDVLFELLGLLPDVEVVLLQGGDAQRAWQRLHRRHPAIRDRAFEVLPTYHPSRQALRTPDPAVRAARQRARLDTYARAAEILGRETVSRLS